MGLVGVVGLTTTAFAADSGNIDPARDGTSSLTVHKYLGLSSDEFGPNNGSLLTGDDIPDLPVAEGVEFTIQQVGVKGADDSCTPINLLTNDGWDQASEVSEDGLGTDYCLIVGSAETLETDESGVAEFEDLSFGMYYVTEGDDNGDNNIVQKVDPFFVTVPYPSYSGETGADHVWTYDVHVYPKNQASEAPEKTIEERPSDLIIGSTVTWTISAVIPDTADAITEASIYDLLDDRLSYVSSTVKIGDADVAAGDVTSPSEGDTDAITWTFTDPQGLAAINANKGKTITVEFVTTVTSVGDGEIENAPGIPDNGYGSSFNDTPTPGETTPATYWGQLAILKTDDSETARVLQGAEFQVFEQGAGACAANAEGAGTAIATGTSGADGVVLWDNATPANSSPLGLWVANYQDVNDVPTEGATKDYCVYETKAPVGYVAGSIANPVTITPGELDENEYTLTVVNTQQDGPDLPLTGADGTRMMIIGGTALVLLAGGLYLVQRRRNHAQQ